MYEDQTFEVIMARKLAKAKEIDPTVDTRVGSLIYLTSAIDAAEQAQLYIELDTVLDLAFADTAPREYLIRRAAERGIYPTPAEPTKTILKGLFTPDTLEITIGTRFRGATLNYAITEEISAGLYKLECETGGVVGNQYLGDLVPVLNVPGLATCQLTEVLIPGEDVEDTEVFRARYKASFNSYSFGGNVAEYIEKVNAITGVGGVKVYPVWAGGGTVKCTIINSSYGVPSAELIAAVQLAVDPVPLAGLGAGTAPIDHTVTITGVTDTDIDIATTITYEDGWNFAAVEPSINAAIDAYLLELNQTWQSTKTLSANTGLIVRISQIETRLLNITGILDIGGTTINDVAANLTLGVDSIAVRGTISG
ncbi:baseplate J/gp47 family protein [Acetobacterium wieringae]|uniref:baseplate J/gp47 family protein n=1 Tax=Acetobacterium wieringae TaxID=52694 RepID=UPI001E370FC8|nr:baseplate J/gp47 family protein [Acetobacterium wieringae]